MQSFWCHKASGESLLSGYEEFLALLCSDYFLPFHQSIGRIGTQALLSPFGKDKASFACLYQTVL